MLWKGGKGYRLQLELSEDPANSENAAASDAQIEGSTGIFDNTWVGRYMDIIGYQGTRTRSHFV